MGHVKMMGAVQPFVSGAISKTANMPESASVDDVSKLYLDSWKLGVKALAIYRDNCKVAQPLAASRPSSCTSRGAAMPIERQEIGRKFQVGEYEGYIHVGLFPDGTPGDVFVDIAKEGTTLAGLMNALMISVSLGIQYGVPLAVYVSKFSHMRFEPSGLTNDPDIRVAKSLVDYIFRWLGKKFLDADTQAELGIMSAEVRARLQGQQAEAEPLADGSVYADSWRRPRRGGTVEQPLPAASERSSTPGRTRRSARSAAGARCAPARATPAATAATTPAAGKRDSHGRPRATSLSIHGTRGRIETPPESSTVGGSPSSRPRGARTTRLR